MKYFKAILSVPLALGLLYGCNANEGDQVTVDNAENNAQTDGTEDNTGIDTQTEGQTQQDENGQDSNATDQNVTDDQHEGEAHVDTPYNFTHFDLDVDYDGDKSYEVDFENNQKGMSAELDDDINNVHATGDDASNKLVKYMESLTFNADSDPQDVLSQVITAFDLDENYREFDLEVRFTNGEVKEYNFTK